MKDKYKLFFILVVALAIILRFWNLGTVPPSPDWDEASLGWNAYSLIETGRDEYGKTFPLILRSFDDYKPALYAYLVIPFISLFGLTTFAVRAPSAIFGVFAVIGTYFLVKELFRDEKYKEQIALLASFLLAISPWHLQFSRIAFEAQVGLSMNILSLLFFIKGTRKNIFLIPSAIFASLSIYVYQSEKVYLPILFFLLLLIYWKDLIKASKKWLIASVLLGGLLCLPMFHSLVSDSNSLLRAKGVSVFSDQTQFLRNNSIRYMDDVASGDYLGMISDNRRIEYAKAIVSGYISHYSLNWLFVTSDIERHHAPFMGLLYLYELPFLLIGIYILIFWPFSIKSRLTILAILLIAPIPASVTSGVPHAVRTINFLPSFQILIALGIFFSWIYFSKLKGKLSSLKYLALIMFILMFSFNFAYYLNQYFVQQNKYYSESWQYGYEEAVRFVVERESSYRKIVVSNEAPLDQSYMFFLFYLKYSPTDYQKAGGTVSGGFREEHKGFGKYTFRPINWEMEEPNSLIVGRPGDVPSSAKILKKINYLNGKPAIIIAEK